MAEGLRLDRLEIRQGGRLLAGLDRTVARGEVLTVMGPSGSGKSSLLAAVIGTLDPAFDLRGRVWLDGRDITHVPTNARRIGLMLQDEILFPHLSMAGNLAFGLPASLRGRRERDAAVAAALDAAGLSGMGARDPATLSGGQRARVALMRTLLAEPRALLLDEPFARLDTALREQIRGFVFARAAERGLPVILVTHDSDDARAAGGPVVDPLGRALALDGRVDQA